MGNRRTRSYGEGRSWAPVFQGAEENGRGQGWRVFQVVVVGCVKRGATPTGGAQRFAQPSTATGSPGNSTACADEQRRRVREDMMLFTPQHHDPPRAD